MPATVPQQIPAFISQLQCERTRTRLPVIDVYPTWPQYADWWYENADPTPTPPVDGTLVVTINGVDQTTNFEYDSFTIHDVLNQPSQCTFVATNGYNPSVGSRIEVLRGTYVMFSGTITLNTQVYKEVPVVNNLIWEITAVDDSFLLRRRLPVGQYTNQSASYVALDLLNKWSSGFTHYIQIFLPPVTITFDGTQDLFACLQALGAKVGAHVYVHEFRHVHFFQTDEAGLPTPVNITDADGPTLIDSPLTMITDLSGICTRVFVEGQGTSVPIECTPGQIIIPVADASIFNSFGGLAVSGPQRLTYTGVTLGGTSVTTTGSSLSGPTPSVAEPSPKVIGKIVAGTYQYKASYVTANGEGSVGSAASLTVTDVNTANVSGSITQAITAGGGLTLTSAYFYAWTVVTTNGETASVGATNFTLTGSNNSFSVTTGPYADARIIRVNIYRGKAGSSNLFLVGSINAASTAWVDTTADINLTGQAIPTSSTAGGGATSITAITNSGDARVTAKNIYRTKIGGSIFYLLTTLGDNTTTSFVDTLNDSALGEPAPTTTTVAIPVASTSLPVTDCAQFSATGGWAIVSGQYISYTGRSVSSGAGSITGIPATGVGSIKALIPYGSTISSTPCITGVPASGTGSILYTILAGQSINILTQSDDTVAQAALAVIEGGDGIHEASLSNSAYTYAECIIAGNAKLQLFAYAIVTAKYATRDINSHVGRSITITRTIPPMSVTLIIQTVDITHLMFTDPIFTNSASTVKFTLQDLLAMLIPGGL